MLVGVLDDTLKANTRRVMARKSPIGLSGLGGTRGSTPEARWFSNKMDSTHPPTTAQGAVDRT